MESLPFTVTEHLQEARHRKKGRVSFPPVGSGGGGRRTKHGRELPHVRGQGQQPRVPGCDGPGTAERSYPVSEVRGDGQEEIPHV